MNGGELIKRIRKVGKANGVPVRFESRQGKGSHGRLYYGSNFTTLKDRKKADYNGFGGALKERDMDCVGGYSPSIFEATFAPTCGKNALKTQDIQARGGTPHRYT